MENRSTSLLQPKLNSFFGITKALAKMPSLPLSEVGTADNTMAIIAINLSNSAFPSENI